MKTLILYCYILLQMVFIVRGCNRKPQGARGDRSPVDENFKILIDGNPATYIPGQRYNISLSCASSLKFLSFTMVIESENARTREYDMLGHFEILDNAETKFGSFCENMIENTNTNIKSRIDVAWIAPTNPDSGCILIKGAVLQHRNVWFIDDGFLTKRICPEEIDDINSQTPPISECCACDQAKYEIILTRKWSRNTHAKDFPVAIWQTRFGEVIGASHTLNYRFWEYGKLASPGLRELAEHGSTSSLENEIKQEINTGNIRTIIKAPSIVYRKNSLGSTLANVRVDSDHHIISLVTKIDPSPDWILGVSGLELCLANCTWIDEKILNLYPWDIGTDSGSSYMSSHQPQIPPDVVRRITSTFPNDVRSPFYDTTGASVKPLATIHIKKKKIYERDCNENTIQSNRQLECVTHPWGSWSACSTKCGHGTQYRTRVYKDPTIANHFKCDKILMQSQTCMGTQCTSSPVDSPVIPINVAECELSPWSSWSLCSKKCGHGYITRTRDYVNPNAKLNCQIGAPMDLEQRKDCFGDDCGGNIINNNNNDIRNELNTKYDNDVDNKEYDIEKDEVQYRKPNFENFLYNPKLSKDPFEEMTIKNFSDDNPYIHNTRGNIEGTNSFSQNNINPYKYDLEHVYRQPDVSDERNDPRIYENIPDRLKNKNKQKSSNNFGAEDYLTNVNDFDQYSIVQDYCYTKPIVTSQQTCKKNKNIKHFWFYDINDRQCKLFATDDCDENKNKFRTLNACEGTCHRPLINLDLSRQQGYK